MILYTGWTCLKVFLQWIFIVIFYILLIIKKIEEGMARKVEYAEKSCCRCYGMNMGVVDFKLAPIGKDLEWRNRYNLDEMGNCTEVKGRTPMAR